MISRQGRVEIEGRVREYLRRGPFRPGDRLPGERELASAVGVGRTALRGVLERLEAEGTLERRPQSGTYLARPPLPLVRGRCVVAVIAPLRFEGGEPPVGGTVAGTSVEWTHRVISAFERRVAASGARVLLLDQGPIVDDPGSVKCLARAAGEAGTAAALLVHPEGTRETVTAALGVLHDRGAHPVVVSATSDSGLASQVYFDSEWGAYLATRHLLEYGHRAIGFAGGPPEHEWVHDRLRGYRQALAASEITARAEWEYLPDAVGLARPEQGAAALRALRHHAQLTAVVAANDAIALGVLAGCREAGIAVPERLSVVGFDNDLQALPAGLTTVDRPIEALGEAAARVTLERIALGPGADTVTLRLRPVLIERATVARAPDLTTEAQRDGGR